MAEIKPVELSKSYDPSDLRRSHLRGVGEPVSRTYFELDDIPQEAEGSGKAFARRRSSLEGSTIIVRGRKQAPGKPESKHSTE